jgi:hypothetical protein
MFNTLLSLFFDMNSSKDLKYKSFLDKPKIDNAFKDVGLFSEKNWDYI